MRARERARVCGVRACVFEVGRCGAGAFCVFVCACAVCVCERVGGVQIAQGHMDRGHVPVWHYINAGQVCVCVCVRVCVRAY